MKSTDKGVGVSAQTTRTKYDGVLLTIRSRKSFFEVIQAIESSLQRFHIPKLMEYVTHGDRAGVEAGETVSHRGVDARSARRAEVDTSSVA
jgi:hypothetical protein